MRDDFTQQTLDILGKRVGMRCSNPRCRKLTTGPRTEPTHIINVGVGAHITGASTGGPRFDSYLSSEARRSPENGIWLCQNCAKLIDNDPAKYPVGLLREWKQKAEDAALAAIEGNPPVESPLKNFAELEIAYKKLKIDPERHDYRLEIRLTNRGTALLGQYHVDVVIPTRVLESPEKIARYVPDRSTQQQSFFRVSSNEQNDDVYPGDTKIIITIPYYIDNEIYWDKGSLFAELVTATLYRQGFQPLVIEVPFEELQAF
jgi:hypothetical protein